MKFIITVFLICFCTVPGIHSQNFQKAHDSLALDPNIRYGRLVNGFTYYLKKLPESGEKVQMELTVRAGSSQQDKDQSEMAHFLEHLPFAGTKHFSDMKDPNLLHDLQMRGTDIGGKTGNDNTVYWFNYPKGNRKAFSKGLLFYHDIASGNIGFQKRDIDGERGAIFQEYLYSNGEKWYKVGKVTSLLSNCLKAIKKPGEFHRYIQNFDTGELKRFYKQWYRPDLMGITIVGDIEDVSAIEKQIAVTFSDIPAFKEPIKPMNCRESYLERPDQFVTLEDGIKRSKDKDSVPIYFQFLIRDNKVSKEKGTFLKYKIIKELLIDMLSHRLREAEIGYNIPYTMSCYPNRVLPALSLNVIAPKTEAKEGVEKAFSVYYAIREKGFEKKEFEKSKLKKIKELESLKTNSPHYWVQEIQQYFVHKEPLPKKKPLKLKEYLNRLSLNEFNGWVRNFLPKVPEDIVIILPEGDDNNFYARKTINKWIKGGEGDNALKSVARKSPSYLISPKKLSELSPVEAVDKGKDRMGAHRYVLGNGLNLILKPYKPTQGRYQDKIMIHGFTPKGASCFPEGDYYSSVMAPDIVKNSGVGSLNKFGIHNFLKGTSLSIGLKPYINNEESGIGGDVKLEDLETALQLIYLYMSDPRLDEAAFRDWKKIEEKHYVNASKANKVKSNLLDKINEEIQNFTISPRGTKRYKGVESVDLKRAYEIYNELFRNGSKFTFIVTGNYTLENVLPLLKKYLGNIPTDGNLKCQKFLKVEHKFLSDRPFTKTYRSHIQIENAHISLKFLRKGNHPVDFKQKIEYDLLTHILTYKLHDLRNKKKRNVYFMFAGTGIDGDYHDQFINIILSCGQEDLENIKNDLNEIITELKTKGIGTGLFREIMDSYVIPGYGDIKSNRNKQVQKDLYDHYQYNVPFRDENKLNRFIRSISKKDIPRIAQKYLKDKYRMEFVMKSETRS